ncbi:MAG: MarR family transcriptional regulator [Clostridiales bacterium]|nr:MarR family transcriptional regulator [Clostridiales bacterium]
MSKSVSELANLIFAYYPKLRKMYRNLVSIKDIPLSLTQLTCLYIINENDELSMSELASDLCMSNQQLTKVVDALVEFEMVERVCDEKNRRKFYASIAPKGRELLQSLKEEVDKKLGYVLRKKSDDELDKLYSAMEFIASYFGYKSTTE